ncbi:MAG: hypothetical protein R2860_05575 [Desulfobacterales bacterium]
MIWYMSLLHQQGGGADRRPCIRRICPLPLSIMPGIGKGKSVEKTTLSPSWKT